jgi:hypothetical protein
VGENKALTVQDDKAAIVEQIVIQGDLSKLSPAQRVAYYNRVCESLGLNPLTKPFDYITLNRQLTLYLKRDGADQLRKIHKVSVNIVAREHINDLYIVTARAILPDGRSDESIGAVPLAGLKGDALANAIMKAETKAKRRVTLSIVGLGWLDETEIETIPDARPVTVDSSTGEIVETPSPPPEPRGGKAKPNRPSGESPDWDAVKLYIVKQKLPIAFRDAFVALAQARGWGRKETKEHLDSWIARYEREPEQCLADLTDSVRLPEEPIDLPPMDEIPEVPH